jgi:hypothetical protein
MATFSAHGTLQLSLDGPILVVEGSGPWNVESLNHSAIIAKPFAQQLKGKHWGVIAILHGQAVYVPEAAAGLTAVVKRDRLNGRVASAVMLDDCESPEFSKEHIANIYREAGEPFQFFSQYGDAKKWLLETIKQAQKPCRQAIASLNTSSSKLN